MPSEQSAEVRHGPASYVLDYIAFAEAYLWLLEDEAEDFASAFDEQEADPC